MKLEVGSREETHYLLNSVRGFGKPPLPLLNL